MPIYSAQCTECNYRFDIFRKISDRNLPANCERCKAPARRIVDKASISPDYEPYQCPITGVEIRGRRAHEENLKKHGCRVYEPGELDDHKRERAKQEEQLLEDVANAAAEVALAMPQEKFEILSGELIHGAEVDMVNRTVPAAITEPITP